MVEMDAARTKKIEKIRKLLALAKDGGATENETAVAMRKAQELIDEEGITETEILAAEATAAFTESGAKNRVPQWENDLVIGLRRAFGCDAIHHQGRGRWEFIGIDPLPEIAQYAFDVLRRQCLEARKAYISSALKRVQTARRKTVRADLFCQGWIRTALGKTTALSRPQAMSAAIAAHIETKYRNLDTVAVLNRKKNGKFSQAELRDFMTGHQEGQGAAIHNGMSVPNAPIDRLGYSVPD